MLCLACCWNLCRAGAILEAEMQRLVLLQVLLGEGASVVLDGQRVLPAKAEEAGYSFKFPDVGSAVRNILR